MARNQFSYEQPAPPSGADNVHPQADPIPASPELTWRNWSFYVFWATAVVRGVLKLAGDLGGTANSPTVVGIQAVPVSSASPADGDVLTYVEADGEWEPQAGGGGGGGTPVRLISLVIDGGGYTPATGFKGSVQSPVAGTLTGWSLELDVSGSISVDVAKHSGTQTAPVVPAFPADKISAAAPIAVSSAQAAGVGSSGLSSWTATAVAQWDSIAFNLTLAAGFTRAVIWLSLQP